MDLRVWAGLLNLSMYRKWDSEKTANTGKKPYWSIEVLIRSIDRFVIRKYEVSHVWVYQSDYSRVLIAPFNSIYL